MTILFALFTLFLLIVGFGIAYITKGLKAAIIVTGVLFIGLAGLYIGMIYLFVNSMN